MKVALLYNGIIIAYLLLITVLGLDSKIAYGYGQGDLIYIALSGGVAILQVIAILIIYAKTKGLHKSRFSFIVGTISLLIAVYFTWGYTLGRGPEYRWDGNVFMLNNLKFYHSRLLIERNNEPPTRVFVQNRVDVKRSTVNLYSAFVKG
jgi:hypothetical protein